MKWKKALCLVLAVLLTVSVLAVSGTGGTAYAADINIRADTEEILSRLNELRNLTEELRNKQNTLRELERQKENEAGSVYTDEYIRHLMDLYASDPDDPEVQQHKEFLDYYRNYLSRRSELYGQIKSLIYGIRNALNNITPYLNWPYSSGGFDEDALDDLLGLMNDLEGAIDELRQTVYELIEAVNDAVAAFADEGTDVCTSLSGRVAVTLHANRDDAYFARLDYYANSPLYHYTQTGDRSEGMTVLMDPDQGVTNYDPYSHFICLSDDYGPFSGGSDDYVYVFAGWADSPTDADPDFWMNEPYTVDYSRDLYAVWKKDLWTTKAVLEYDSVPYDGTAKEPSVTVTRGSNVLREGVDYVLTYSYNVGNPNSQTTASVAVTGIGEWWQSRNR